MTSISLREKVFFSMFLCFVLRLFVEQGGKSPEISLSDDDPNPTGVSFCRFHQSRKRHRFVSGFFSPILRYCAK